MSRVVRIEIRGVGGETAEEILQAPVTQVSGDRHAGFYQLEASGAVEPDVEAYEWGRLTSGAWSTAVWWILFPFTLMNVAGWMLQPNEAEQGTDDEDKRSSLWFARLLVVGGGLAITAVYVAWTATITTEILAFGCAGDKACSDRWYLAPISWFDKDPIWLVTLGVGIAALLILSLFLFILRTQDKLEGYEKDPERRRIGSADLARSDTSRLRRNTKLENQGFWYKWHEHRRLFRWHLGLTMMLLGAAAGHAMQRTGSAGKATAAWIGVVGMLVALAIMVWLLNAPEKYRDPGGDGPIADESANRRALWTTVHIALSIVGYGFATLATGTPASTAVPTFSYLDAIRTLSMSFYGAAILAFLLLFHRRFIRKDRYLSDGALWLLPGLAAGLAITIAGAGFVATAHLLGRALRGAAWVQENGFDIALIDIFVAAIVVTALISYVSYRRTRKPIDEVKDDYFAAEEVRLSDRDAAWIREVANARVVSLLPSQGDKTIGVLVSVLLIISAIQLWRGGFDVTAGPDSAFASPLFGIEGLAFLHPVAAALIVLYVFPGVQLIRKNAQSRKSRRQLGKVWDVLSFWPRRFHPLAAPCYAERAVPEFRDRIRHHLLAGNNVIVSSHSQGTVIAFAALVQIGAESDDLGFEIDGHASYKALSSAKGEQRAAELENVGLVTFGSPLSTLYGRFFAAHFGTPGRLQQLRDQLATLQPSGRKAWINLWRPTDYIGQQVFVEPGGTLSPPEDGTDIEIREAQQPLFSWEAHSNYEREDELEDTIELFIREM